MNNLSETTRTATLELYEELRAAIGDYLETNADPDQRHEAYRQIMPHLLNQPGDLVAQRTIRLTAQARKTAANGSNRMTGRANDYSLKRRAALLQMRRDVDTGRRPAPRNTIPEGF